MSLKLPKSREKEEREVERRREELM